MEDSKQQEGGEGTLNKNQMREAGLYDLFGDAYGLLQANAGQQAIDWQAAVAEADKICHEREGTELAEMTGKIVWAIMDYLEKASRDPAAFPLLEKGRAV